MPFRFRKSIKLGKGVRLNLSKSGVSTSIGKPGATVNIGKRGVRPTVGIPGTGISYTPSISNQTVSNSKPKSNRYLLNLIIFTVSICLLCFIGLCLISIFSDSGSAKKTPTPTITVQSVETIIMQTANAANIQTQNASSPTPFETSTSLPTLTPPPNSLLITPESNSSPIVLPTSTSTPTPTSTIIIPTLVPPSNSNHPPGTSGRCNDGTYTSAQHSQGACSHHGGIAVWWGP